MKVKSESEVAQSCPTLSDPRDCSPPGFSVHGIFQARVLEWVAIALGATHILISGIQGWRDPLNLHSTSTSLLHFKRTMVQKNFKIFQIKQIFPSILKEGDTIGSPCPSPSLSHSLAGDQALSGLMFRETGVGGTDSCLFPSRALLCFHSSE